jgi:hypothetical protein
MNTGLQDAWNLAWKLDLAARGYATEELLASYTAERLPVIRQVVGATHFMTKVMTTPNRLVQAARNIAIPLASRMAPFQHAFVRRLSGLGVAYQGSPIVEGAGERYFDDSPRGGEGIRSRFLLMLGNYALEPDLDAAARLAESFSDVVELRGSKGRGLMLIRPDGYAAYPASRNPSVALPSVRTLLEQHTVRR